MTNTVFKMGNPVICSKIETEYNNFMNSEKSLDDYFGATILHAIKRKTEFFVIQKKKIRYKRVIMIFSDDKKVDNYYFGQDFSRLKSLEPIRIRINSLLELRP